MFTSNFNRVHVMRNKFDTWINGCLSSFKNIGRFRNKG